MEEPKVNTLYKYKPVNQFTMDIIVSEKVFFPVPARFNNPFDTKCYFRSASGEDGIVAFTRHNRLNDIQLFQSELEKFGVLSLTARPQNTIMWSHYANVHKGICIGFERSPENMLGKKENTSKVNYTIMVVGV
jgi:hypothetical protein